VNRIDSYYSYNDITCKYLSATGDVIFQSACSRKHFFFDFCIAVYVGKHCNVGPRLGQGAFGVVVRALANGIRSTEPTTVVAVKMVKGNK